MTDNDEPPLLFVPRTVAEAGERLRGHIAEYMLMHLQTPMLISVPWDVLVLVADSGLTACRNDVLYFEDVPLRLAADADPSMLSSPLPAKEDGVLTTDLALLALLGGEEDEEEDDEDDQG